MAPRHDAIRGALAYIDGALSILPRAMREARYSTWTRPARALWGAGKITAILWLVVLVAPGLGLGLVLGQSAAAWTLLSVAGALLGWTLFAWFFPDPIPDAEQGYGQLLRQECEQVDRFFLGASNDPMTGRYMGWEGGHPLEADVRVTRRVLWNTKRKLEWLSGRS